MGTAFIAWCAQLAAELGRPLRHGDRIRAANAYSRGEHPAALASLIRRGR
jgi:hypothetical protein